MFSLRICPWHERQQLRCVATLVATRAHLCQVVQEEVNRCESIKEKRLLLKMQQTVIKKLLYVIDLKYTY